MKSDTDLNYIRTRLIAFYLPQFHPIPENDRWWSKGFTEWTNVVRAKPLFPGHYQPHIPADLGFYDLRLPESRQSQADLAREYGIYGFCYYHYWFNGKRLLERPFNEVLASGKPDFPFCLAWANEPWSRRWHGNPEDVLQPQTYGGDEDDIAHIRWLARAFHDNRYIKVEGKPLFLIYRVDQLPDPSRTVALWHKEVARAGLPGIHLVSMETSFNPGWDPTQAGFDASLLFQPQFHKALRYSSWVPLLQRFLARLQRHDIIRYYDYRKVWPILDICNPVPYRRYYSVCPGWDNTPRRGGAGFILHNSTPQAYEEWLTKAISRVQTEPRDHQIVFINAWNEWAEGNHLEPDFHHGLAYLEATKRALLRTALSNFNVIQAKTVFTG